MDEKDDDKDDDDNDDDLHCLASPADDPSQISCASGGVWGVLGMWGGWGVARAAWPALLCSGPTQGATRQPVLAATPYAL